MLRKRINRNLRQTMWRGTVSGGLDLSVLPMPGFRAKAAQLSVKFGSVDMDFAGADGSARSTPPGIAHFLEHELFKKEGHDALLEYGRWGASANAFTDYTTTVYLFRCTDHFEECFRLLLDFTLNPWFDDAYIEKERKIIAQELRMYDDSPDYLAYRNLMPALFRVHPVRVDIGGTVESIGRITREQIEELYDGFYRVDNMHLTVAGDVDPRRVEGIAADAVAGAKRPRRPASRALPAEPVGVERDRVDGRMSSSRARMIVGTKDVGVGGGPAEILRDRIEMGIAMELVFGRTGDFYTKGYKEGILDDTFASAYRRDLNFGFTLVGGETARPEELAERVVKEHRAKRRFHARDVARAKRKRLGRYIASFDSPAGVAEMASDAVTAGIDPFEVLDAIKRVRPGSVADRWARHGSGVNTAVSIVRP